MTAKERPISIGKVIEITGYSRGYIYNLIHTGKIPHWKPTGKKGRIFFFESEIIGFIARNKKLADYEIRNMADTILNAP
jgi:excisionase family DNA binding protein